MCNDLISCPICGEIYRRDQEERDGFGFKSGLICKCGYSCISWGLQKTVSFTVKQYKFQFSWSSGEEILLTEEKDGLLNRSILFTRRLRDSLNTTLFKEDKELIIELLVKGFLTF